MVRHIVRAIVSLSVMLIVSTAAQAQSPSEVDIIKALSLRPDKADNVVGLRSLDGAFGERGIVAEEETEIPSIDIRVNFALDSVKLENETLLTLRTLANALNSDELIDQQILIIGHTDGRGTDQYNDDLSKRRAASVVSFLVETYGFSRDRIQSGGRGESELLYPDDPNNDLNRRVEIQNITGR